MTAQGATLDQPATPAQAHPSAGRPGRQWRPLLDIAARHAGPVVVSVALCLGSPAALAADDDTVATMKRAIEELQIQNRALAARLAALEAERSERRAPARTAAAPRPAPVPVSPKPSPAPAPAPVVEVPPEPATILASPPAVRLPAGGATTAASGGDLERRVRELETSRTAQEDAVRSIIRDTTAKSGPKINEFVTFGGSIEVFAGWGENFNGQSKDTIQLSTAELDFEIRPNEWLLGDLILQYNTGTGPIFSTNTNFNASGVDRITIDRATVTVGDVQRFPLYIKAGQDVLPFGTSTGVHRTDTLSIENPLTIETFEMRRVAVGIGFGLPTPALAPPGPPQYPPAVRPLVISPLVGSLARHLGYSPPPARPPAPTPVTIAAEPPAFYGNLNVYEANTVPGVNRNLGSSISSRLGYRMGGHCGRPYDQLTASDFCPWAIDANVDFNSSLFSSLFLESEYQPYLNQIGLIPGLAASIKMSLGPLFVVGEWNGAMSTARFVDGTGRRIAIRPSAWQVGLGYQFDWNPWVDAIGAQGDYLALGFSRSGDLAGVNDVVNNTPSRVGFVPESRLLLTAAEWVFENARLAVEYSHNWDYPKSKGGTGKQVDGAFVALTLVW